MSCKHTIIDLCQDDFEIHNLKVDTIDSISGTLLLEGIPVSSGTIDGRDISIDGQNLDDHISDYNNPHLLDRSQIGLGSLDTPDFKNVISDEPTQPSHLATKYYVDNSSGGGGYENNVELGTIRTTRLTEIIHNTLIVNRPVGNYKLEYSCEINNDSEADLIVYIRLGGIEIEHFRSKSLGDYNQKIMHTGIAYLDLNGLHTITLSFIKLPDPAGLNNYSVSVGNSKLSINL